MFKKHKSTDEESANKMNGLRTGFAALSRVLAGDEDRFSMVFKRFDRLAAQSLAYMQSELKYLQVRLDTMDDVDERYQGPPKEEEDRRRGCLKSWAGLRDAVDANDETQLKRFNLIMDIRSKLKAYR